MRLGKLWTRIHQMSSNELEAFGLKHKVDMSLTFDDLSHAARHVCEQLNVAKDEPPAGAELDEEVTEHARKHNCGYSEALAALVQNPSFRRRWDATFA